MKLLSILPVVLLTACAGVNWQNVEQTLGTPQQVQLDVMALGAVAKSSGKMSSKVQSDIHTFAVQLGSLANLDSSRLIALIPKTGNPTGDALIASSAGFINIALARWGANNSTALAYAHAVANGLLSDF